MIFTQKDIALQRGSNTTTSVISSAYSSSASVVYKDYLELILSTATIKNGAILKPISLGGTFGSITGTNAVYFVSEEGFIFKNISGTTEKNICGIDKNGKLNVGAFEIVNDSKTISLTINNDGNMLVSGSDMTDKPVIQSIIDGVYQDLLINPNGGNVSINTEYSEGYQLNVNGTIKSKDLTITNGTYNNVLSTNSSGKLTLNGENLGARIYKIDELLAGTFSSEDISNSVNAYVGKNLLQRVTAIENTGSQPSFNGVGFLKVSGSTISYDNSTYLTSSALNGYALSSAIPTNTNQLTNGSGFIINTDSRLSDSRVASDVYSWAKQSSKPTYSWSEISSKPTVLSAFSNDLGNYGGWITGINSSMVTTALNYTPVNTTDSRLSDSRVASDVYSWAKASTKPFYSWSEIISRPTTLSAFSNDLGNYGNWCVNTDARLSDSRVASDVYSWAKQASKPAYSWSEISSKPTVLSAFSNDLGNYGNFATHRGEGTNFIDYSYGMYDAYRGGWRTSNDLYVAYAYNSNQSTIVRQDPTGSNVADLIYSNMADNDFFRLRVGGTATNAGYVELATADDGTEPIHIRQYTGVFSNLVRTATLLDGNGNTSFPGHVYGGGNLYLNNNYGNTIVGAYDASKIQGVFAMGQAYMLPADGTNSGNLYGMAWSHPNAGGQASNLSSHGLLLMQNGVTMAALSTNIWCSGQFNGNGAGLTGTAPNLSVNYATTANKLNGAAHTNGGDGWWRSDGNCGWYSESYGVGIYATEGSNVRTYNNANFIANNITSNGAFYGNGSNLTQITKMWSESHPTSYYLRNNWDGTYWQLTSNHTSAVNVGHSDQSTNSDTVDGIHIWKGSLASYNSISKDANTMYVII